MSLVERALKKLQESRVGAPAGQETPSFHRPVAASIPMGSSARNVEHRGVEHHSDNLVERVAKVEPSRRVAIDRNALRAMELLPPENMERQIASQYQHVKRPLIASARAKGEAAIPNGHVIMLASALSGEGKTFTSVNLALSMALEKDTQILLVDADVAKPHLSKLLGLQAERGLLDLLTDGTMSSESVILQTDVPGLSVLPAGQQVETATELLASKRMEEVVRQLASPGAHRIVLFDSPPLLLSTESRALVPSMGQIVLVVRAESTSQRAVQDALDVIGDGKPVSLILNQVSTPPSSGYYGYGTYGVGATGENAESRS